MFSPSIAYEWRELTDDGRLVSPVCGFLSGENESEARAYSLIERALDQGLISTYDTVKLVLVKTVQPREDY